MEVVVVVEVMVVAVDDEQEDVSCVVRGVLIEVEAGRMIVADADETAEIVEEVEVISVVKTDVGGHEFSDPRSSSFLSFSRRC